MRQIMPMIPTEWKEKVGAMKSKDKEVVLQV